MLCKFSNKEIKDKSFHEQLWRLELLITVACSLIETASSEKPASEHERQRSDLVGAILRRGSGKHHW